MKHTLILAGAVLLSVAAAPALAGDWIDHGAYAYDDGYAPYDPYYDDRYYNGYSDNYAPRYRRKHRRRSKYYGGYRRYGNGGGIQTPAQQGGMRGR